MAQVDQTCQLIFAVLFRWIARNKTKACTGEPGAISPGRQNRAATRSAGLNPGSAAAHSRAVTAPISSVAFAYAFRAQQEWRKVLRLRPLWCGTKVPWAAVRNTVMSRDHEQERKNKVKKTGFKPLKMGVRSISVAVLPLIVLLGTLDEVKADEADAKRMVKAMSAYMAGQKSISFGYDSILEVVTKDHQTLALASSGNVLLRRPDKIRATRSGGFADVEMLFDGKTLTLLGKNANLYAQAGIPGSVDHLIDELKNKYDRPLPAADLLMTDIEGQLMPDVIDTKDLGSGVIGGIECDHFAFRTKEVDWQIWIAQGDRPYPCRYVIKSMQVADGPEYSIQVRDWKTGDEVAADDFGFENTTKAKKIDPKDIPDELPKQFMMGGAK